MYKKQFTVQGQNLLSKKDLKGLKTQLTQDYPGLTEEALDGLLPDGQVKVLKLDNRSLLYGVEESSPVFFDAEGRGELYPTLPTLWRHPYMMLELTIHPPVSKFVLNGADLMLPGLLVPANGVAGFGTVSKGQKRCIKIDGNPYPIAVGKMLVNQAQMEKLKGKGMEVMHVYKDSLWVLAGKGIPNAGFSEKDDEVTPCSASSYGAEASSTAAPVAKTAEGAGENSPVAATATNAASSTAAPAATENSAKEGAAQEGTPKVAADWSQDDLLEFCFMQAFKQSLTDDKMLPVEASELYEKHMKPQRPEGTTLDVKKSSHKQIGKFLNVMRKAKVIDVNEKKGVISVTKIDLGHKNFVQLEKKFATDIKDAEEKTAASDSAGATPASASLPPPQISALWKPTHYTEGFFKAQGKSKSDLYPWEQVKALLLSYVEKEGLGKSADEPVKLNEELITTLYRAAGAQKKDLKFPEEVDFSELEDKMQDRMTEHTVIDVAGVGPTTRKGPPLKIEMSLSRKGAHNITRICNLEAYGLDVQSLGDELKKKLNCTVHIEDMPGKNAKDKMMQLQGHVSQEVTDYLQERYGITKNFMSVK